MGLYAERYGKHEALFGLYLLNEPSGDVWKLQDYYKRTYDRIRQHSNHSYVVISPLNGHETGAEAHWTGFMNPAQGYHNVAMDLHFYSCFGGEADKKGSDAVIGYVKKERMNQILDYMKKSPKPLLIGEWSACGQVSEDRVWELYKAQVEVYNQANLGWTFWSWTVNPMGNRWSLKAAFEKHWVADLYPC